MKEQWKKHDSDAKLLHNVEEGRPLPIKIELPISAFGLKQDGCCNRLITFLRVAVLLVLLIILSWTAATLYSNYYFREFVADEKSEQLVNSRHDYSSDENKSSFRNKVYAALNEQDSTSNEIDPFILTTGSAVATELRNVIVIDPGWNQEDKIIRETPNIDTATLEIKNFLTVSKEDSHLEDASEPASVNEAEDPAVYRTILINVPDVDEVQHPVDDSLDKLDLADKSELSATDSSVDQEITNAHSDVKYDEKVDESLEVPVFPKDEQKAPDDSDEDVYKNMEHIEVEDIEQLFDAIAGHWEIFAEPSSEVDQSKEESAAVVQEEIKESAEKLEVADLEKIGSVEEQSTEEPVAMDEVDMWNNSDEEKHINAQYFQPDMELVPLEEPSSEVDQSKEESAPSVEELNSEVDQSREESEVPAEEPSSEADQSTEESVAVVQEEIKESAEKLEVADLEKIGSVEEQSTEEPVAMDEVDMWNNSDEDKYINAQYFQPDMELNTESVAVVQEEIKSPPHNMYRPEHDITEIVTSLKNPLINVEQSEEKNSPEDASIDDLEKSISQEVPSVDYESRAVLSIVEPSGSVKLSRRVSAEEFVVIYAKLLAPLVGDDYRLIHWYFSEVKGQDEARFASDRRKLYAARILFNTEITEYKADLQMWINEIEGDLVIPETPQMHPESYLQKQIAETLLAKFLLTVNYELNLINYFDARREIMQFDSNYLKSWFLATHPSALELTEEYRSIAEKMKLRRLLYSMMNFDQVRSELIQEHEELSRLSINYDYLYHYPDIKTSEIVLLDMTAESSPIDYTANHEYQAQQLLLKAIIDLTLHKESERDYDYSGESSSKHQSIIEAMKKVGEEYEQTQKPVEEATVSLIENNDNTFEPIEMKEAYTSNDDGNEDDGKSEQFEPSNTDIHYPQESETESDELSMRYNHDTSILNFLYGGGINIGQDENEEEDPFDY